MRVQASITEACAEEEALTPSDVGSNLTENLHDVLIFSYIASVGAWNH